MQKNSPIPPLRIHSVFSFQFSIFRSLQSRTQRTEKPEYWGRCPTSIVAEGLNRDLNHEKLYSSSATVALQKTVQNSKPLKSGAVMPAGRAENPVALLASVLLPIAQSKVVLVIPQSVAEANALAI